MHFQSVTLILAFALAKGLMASPVVARATDDDLSSNDYVEVFRETADDGFLVYYGYENNTESASAEKRASCSSSVSPVCSSDNAARNVNCNTLYTQLAGNSATTVQTSPRQICYEGTSDKDSYCCVSWHNVVSGLTKGDLANQAIKILDQCDQNGISGKISNVNIRGTCTNVCMSSRGTHC